MNKSKFSGWFSDVGFTVRVLIICDMLLEWADSWQAHDISPFKQAVLETQETALLEMRRWEEIGTAAGYFRYDEQGTGTILPSEVPPSLE